MRLLPVDTAITVIVNAMALIDDTDSKTREMGIVYNQAGMDLVWNFETTAGVPTQAAVTPTTAGDYDWTHLGDGIYTIEIPASGGASINNDTEGYGWFSGFCTGVLPWTGPTYSFVPSNVVNGLVAGTDNLQVDTIQVSGDSVAADNLELQYDGTGLSGDTYPATQAAVNSIGAASGGSVNIEASEDNTGGAIIDGVTFVGSISGGTFADTAVEGGNHTMDDAGNIIKIVYGFNVTGSKVSTGVTYIVNLNGNTDEIVLKAYDHVNIGWDIVSTISGTGGAAYASATPALLPRHTGTGSELGKVYLYFDTVSTTPSRLDVKLLLVSAVSTSTSVGYANGAYWIDSAGTSGVEIGTNGTADNPCPWANAITMNATQSLNRFHIANGNTVTLAANSDNLTLLGEGWTLALGGQSIDGASFTGATNVTGTGTATARPKFIDCNFGATATIPPSIVEHCGFGGTFTGGTAGDFDFHECFSQVAGASSPTFVFSGLGSTVNIGNRGWFGGGNYTLDSDCVLSHEVVAGGHTNITANGASVELRGTTKKITLAVTGSEVVNVIGVTGLVTINGTTSVAASIINLSGVAGQVTNNALGLGLGATINNDAVNAFDIDRNADLIESQRGTHTWQGNIFYCCPTYGNDCTGDGTRVAPYKTMQAVHDDLFVDSNHDILIMLSDNGGGATTHTVNATTTISKRYCFIRGPGRDMIITRGDDGPVFTITADGCEISGVQIRSHTSGTGSGIELSSADFLRVKSCWFNLVRGIGVKITTGSNCQLHDNMFEGVGSAGTYQSIEILGGGGVSDNINISNNHIHNSTGDAIKLSTGTTNDAIIAGNQIKGSAGIGINITASATDTIMSNNVLGNNTGGDISDSGTDTIDINNAALATSTALAVVDGVVETRLPAALVGGRMDANVGAISGSATAADNLEQSALGIVVGAAATGTLSTTQATTNLTETTDEHYNRRLLLFVTGVLAGQATVISAYNGTSKMLTFDTLTEAPSNGDGFVIL